ncbi:hypothetical protein Hanom_Chr05g00442681 [Helianthus anomalus]
MNKQTNNSSYYDLLECPGELSDFIHNGRYGNKILVKGGPTIDFLHAIGESCIVK